MHRTLFVDQSGHEIYQYGSLRPHWGGHCNTDVHSLYTLHAMYTQPYA